MHPVFASLNTAALDNLIISSFDSRVWVPAYYAKTSHTLVIQSRFRANQHLTSRSTNYTRGSRKQLRSYQVINQNPDGCHYLINGRTDGGIDPFTHYVIEPSTRFLHIATGPSVHPHSPPLNRPRTAPRIVPEPLQHRRPANLEA